MNRLSYLSLACAIGLLGNPVHAQETEAKSGSRPYFASYESHRIANVAAVEKKYFAALSVDNDGVVESALAHIARMKLYMPCSTCDELHQKIHSLAVVGQTPAIRFRAYLTDVVLDSPELFVREQRTEYQDAEEMFSALSARLQSSLLSLGDRKYVRGE